MNTKTVKVYDLATQQVREIPEAELAPGMVLADVTGVGRVWIEAAKMKQAEKYRHPPFDEEIRAYFHELKEALDEVCPRTIEEWEHGFRLDNDPASEIALWLHMAKVYRTYIEDHHCSAEQRREVFRTVITCSMAPLT